MVNKADPKKKVERVVTGALVAVKFTDGTVGQLARGDVLPDSVSKESVDILDGLGFLSNDK